MAEIVRASFNTDINLDWRGDGQSLAGTAYNSAGQSSVEKKCGDGSLYFPNNNSYIDYAGVVLPDYDIFTISIWIKGSGNGRYFQCGDSPWNNAAVFQVASSIMNIKVRDGSPTSHDIAVFDYTSYSGWNHFEVNVNGNSGNHYFFLNGIIKGSAGGVFVVDRTASPLRMGQNWNKPVGESYYQDELVIYDSVQHTSDFTPPPCPAAIISRLLDAQGRVVSLDASGRRTAFNAEGRRVLFGSSDR